MEKTNIDLFLVANADKFPPEMIPSMRQMLEAMPEQNAPMLQTINFSNPTTILLIAILLGWERFFINDIGLGVLKVLTCQGCGIWWLIDIFSANERARKFNYQKFMQAMALMR